MSWQTAPLRIAYRLTQKRFRLLHRREVWTTRYLALLERNDPCAAKVWAALQRWSLRDREWGQLQRAALQRDQEIRHGG